MQGLWGEEIIMNYPMFKIRVRKKSIIVHSTLVYSKFLTVATEVHYIS